MSKMNSQYVVTSTFFFIISFCFFPNFVSLGYFPYTFVHWKIPRKRDVNVCIPSYEKKRMIRVSPFVS